MVIRIVIVIIIVIIIMSGDLFQREGKKE